MPHPKLRGLEGSAQPNPQAIMCSVEIDEVDRVPIPLRDELGNVVVGYRDGQKKAQVQDFDTVIVSNPSSLPLYLFFCQCLCLSVSLSLYLFISCPRSKSGASGVLRTHSHEL